MNFAEVGKEVLKFILANEAILGIIFTAVGSILWYLIDNYIHLPKAKVIAYEIAKAVEKETEEETTIDTFLDAFIEQYEKKFGKEPSAGELKTAADVRKKKQFSN